MTRDNEDHIRKNGKNPIPKLVYSIVFYLMFIFNNKNIKDIGYNSVKIHQTNSFSPVFSKSFLNKNTKKLFFPGCSLSSYSPEIVLKTYEYLKENISDLSIAFKCCGKPTLSMGDVDKFKIYYSQVENLFLVYKLMISTH